ncbi:MAG TPA: LuxR C-terminal-related transcriptional regulator, partial [Chloroflexota bacterium]|nr:LuxR C-terminal-related transcriptional regulator [Chloroflexota bacterium]
LAPASLASALRDEGFDIEPCSDLSDLETVIQRHAVQAAIIVTATAQSSPSDAERAQIARLCLMVPTVVMRADVDEPTDTVARLTRALHSQPPAATSEPTRLPAVARDKQLDLITPRQKEIASLVADGLTNAEIAARLVVAQGTVANHVAEILQRLGFRSRTQIAIWAAIRLHGSVPTPGTETTSHLG